MNKFMHFLVGTSIGLITGAFLTKKYLRKEYESKINDEVDSIRKAYADRLDEISKCICSDAMYDCDYNTQNSINSDEDKEEKIKYGSDEAFISDYKNTITQHTGDNTIQYNNPASINKEIDPVKDINKIIEMDSIPDGYEYATLAPEADNTEYVPTIVTRANYIENEEGFDYETVFAYADGIIAGEDNRPWNDDDQEWLFGPGIYKQLETTDAVYVRNSREGRYFEILKSQKDFRETYPNEYEQCFPDDERSMS